MYLSEKYFGEVFKQILEEGMTIQKLSKLTGVSRTHLYRICNNESEPSFYILHKLSRVLSVDVVEYYKIYTDFSDFNEYKRFLKLRELIENDKSVNIEELDEFLKQIKLCEIKKGIYRRLIFYSKAIVSTAKDRNYNKAIKQCFMALDVKDVLFKANNIEKYITYEIDYSSLHLLAHNYFNIGEIDKSLEIGKSLIAIVEKRYIHSSIVNMELPKIVFRAYIATINNVADTLFNTGEYEETIMYCNKGIEFLDKENSLYVLAQLYEIKAQSVYMLGNHEMAIELFMNAKYACFTSKDREHLSRLDDRIKKYYPNYGKDCLYE